MNYLGSELAILKRLVGYPVASNGEPVADKNGVPVNRLLIGPPGSPDDRKRLPSYGMRIPSVRNAGSKGTNSQSVGGLPYTLRDVSAGVSWRRVPVLRIGHEGVPNEDRWPSVTVHFMDEAFNPGTYVYYDHLTKPAPTAPLVPSGTHSTRTAYRPHPEAHDLSFMIRVYSKDALEILLLMEAVHTLFPARGCLEVEQRDGTTHPCDMFLSHTEFLDSGGSSLRESVDGQRGFSRGFVYKIEAYQDNTTNKEQAWEEQVILSRVLEIYAAQDALSDSAPIALVELDAT